MANVETVKAKLQTLVAECQAATGDSSNDLTAQLALLTGLTAAESDGSTPTIETVETKLQNLLTICQAKTGDSSADLTTHVQLLIDEFSATDTPTMYLYGREATADETANVIIDGVGYVGAVLPKLPEWDKTIYPYAVMVGNYFYALSVPVTCKKLMPYVTNIVAPYVCSKLIEEPNDICWGELTEYITDKTDYGTVVWANHQILLDDGSEIIEQRNIIPMCLPLVLYDGSFTATQSGDFGSLELKPMVYGFNEGDTLRITFDGETTDHVARVEDGFYPAFVGNRAFRDSAANDDGGNFLLTHSYLYTIGAGRLYWYCYCYTRTVGTHTMKIELIKEK